MLVECILLIVLVLFLLQQWKKKDIYKLGKELKSGVTALPVIGHSYLFFGNNETRMKAFRTLGRDAINNENGLTAFWLGNYLYTMIAEPEAADFVLKSCLQKDDIMKMSNLFIGNGSIFAPVSIWKPRRKVLLPTFGTKSMKHFLTIFNNQGRILVEQMNKVAGTGIVSAWKYYTSYTMDSIAEATLGHQMHAQEGSRHPFLKSFEEGLSHCAERLCSPWLHCDLLYHNLPIYKQLLEMKNYLWGFVRELIQLKRNEMKSEAINDEKRDDSASEERLKTFLELLIRSSGGDDGYTDIEVIEELMVIMVAGNDTTAVGLSFLSMMLARHPEVQEKVYKELQEVFGDSDRPVTSEDLPRLKYMDAVIKETLRLYTPVPIITRKVENEVILPSGLKIVPGTGVTVNIWALHRNPRCWGEDAEYFRPERFIDTPLKHPAAFMPFSYGPRNCVGYQFAMTSMKTTISGVLRRFKILPAKKSMHSEHPPLRLKFDLMMKDAEGFQIQLEHRI